MENSHDQKVLSAGPNNRGEEGQDRYISVAPDLSLHVRTWPGNGPAFVLVHGLASNCLTWEPVAKRLHAAGHSVVTVDQRGHGLSDKPDDGYDFDTVAGDLHALLDALSLDQPYLLGQSWGGNVMLAFGALFPGRARGLGFIDGGFLDLKGRPNGDWAQIAEDLKPPDLVGIPLAQMEARMTQYHPDWSAESIAGALGNFEVLPDGTICPWLTLGRHMKILRALWEQHPSELYPKVTDPVLICPAVDSSHPDWRERKRREVAVAEANLARVAVHWFEETDHDIHMHRPTQLAQLILDTAADGIWAST